MIAQGAGLGLAGALVVLPALAAAGLLEVAETVSARGRAAFTGGRSLLLTIAFAALVGASRAEGLARIDPADLGRLIGGGPRAGGQNGAQADGRAGRPAPVR